MRNFLQLHPLLCLRWLCIAAPILSPASAQGPWKEEKEPERHALIFGAANYQYLAPLAAVDRDVQRVAEKLKDLNFHVTRAVLTSTSAFDSVMRVFAPTVKRGDLVVVYFSGHGFLYRERSYIAPTDLKTPFPESELRYSAVSLTEIEQSFDRRKPGFVLVIADACRIVGNFVVAPPPGDELKSANDPLESVAQFPNSIFAVASRDGTPAIGASAMDSLSPFTAGLLKYLAAPGKEFRYMFLDVKRDVYTRTGMRQQPWLYDFALSELYLNPDDSVKAQERREWGYIVDGGTRSEIADYLTAHPVNRHAAAARAWLDAHQGETARGTAPGSLVSPQAIELAFEQRNGRQAISRFHSGLLFDRSLDLSEFSDATSLTYKDFSFVPSGTRAMTNVANYRSDAINLYVAHGSALTTQPFFARSEPTMTAPVVTRIPTGTWLRFASDPVVNPRGGWVSTMVPGDTVPVFVYVAPVDSAAPLELGRPLLEIPVGPVSVGIPDIVDERPLREAIARLRREGKTITWVSIATGATSSDSASMMRSRSRYAKYVVRDLGIDLRAISTVSQSPGVTAGVVRLRIFGY